MASKFDKSLLKFKDYDDDDEIEKLDSNGEKLNEIIEKRRVMLNEPRYELE